MKYLQIPLLTFLVLTIGALTTQAAQLATAKVISVTGTVTVYSSGGGNAPMKVGDILKQGDSVSATALSEAMIVFSNGSELTIKENTSINISKLEQNAYSGGLSYEQLEADPSASQTLLELNYGEVAGHVKKLRSDSSFQVETPIGTAAIRGTQFTMRLFYNAERGEFILWVENLDGKVDIISRYAGEIEYEDRVGDKGFNSGMSNEVSEPIPGAHKVVIRLSRKDPFFNDLFSRIQNYIPEEPRPGFIEIPIADFTPDDLGVVIISPEDGGDNDDEDDDDQGEDEDDDDQGDGFDEDDGFSETDERPLL